jgi:putative exosortase-associated protein (TIGR04073 family)
MKRYGRRHTVRVKRHGRFNIRKFISSTAPFILVLTLAIPLQAAEEQAPAVAEQETAQPAAAQPATEYKPAGEKLAEGIGETATGWVEVPKQMVDTSKETNPIEGVTVGTIKGAGETAVKTTTGAIKTGTFYIPEEKKEPVEEEAPKPPEQPAAE